MKTISFPGYGEFRQHKNSVVTIQILNGNIVTNTKSTTSGTSVRIYEGGYWGFSSSPGLKDSLAASLIEKAASNARFLSQKAPKKIIQFPEKSVKIHKDHATKKTRWSQTQIIDFLRNIDAYIEKKFPNLLSRKVTHSSLDIEKTVQTATGTTAYTFLPRAHIIVLLTLRKNEKTVELYDFFGSLGQWEDCFTQPENFYPQIDALYTKLLKKSEGIFPQAGEHDVILAPDLAGILAHEAVGHTTEADLVLGGSIAGHLVGKMVASPLVSMVDFAHEALGQLCPVPVYVDDEGVPAEDVVLIENGELKGFMHNRETAEHFSAPITGNARAFQFYDEPLIRMRNTAVLPGKSKFQEMIASIESGYLLSNAGNGQADSTSEFMFAVKMGYEIKNGKLGRAIQDTTISGVAFEMLKSVSMVSDDMVWENMGFCGKKQPMTVGMGGPAIKCRVNLGGR